MQRFSNWSVMTPRLESLWLYTFKGQGGRMEQHDLQDYWGDSGCLFLTCHSIRLPGLGERFDMEALWNALQASENIKIIITAYFHDCQTPGILMLWPVSCSPPPTWVTPPQLHFPFPCNNLPWEFSISLRTPDLSLTIAVMIECKWLKL